MVVTAGQTLNRNQVIDYVGQRAGSFGLDPAAVLSVANHEGLNTTPGSTWRIPGESGFNFGPPSWYSGGAGGAIVNQHAGNAPLWSWTPAGLDYWLAQVGQVASGLTGKNAIAAIVHKFERPREDLAQGEIDNAWHDYPGFQTQIGGGVTDVTPSPIDIPGQAPVEGQTPAQGTVGVGKTPDPTSSMNLDFNGTMQHTIMQILLVIVAIALILGGIYLIGSKS